MLTRVSAANRSMSAIRLNLELHRMFQSAAAESGISLKSLPQMLASIALHTVCRYS